MEQHAWDFPEAQALWPCGTMRVSREALSVWFDTNIADAKCLYVQGPVKRGVFWQLDTSDSAGYNSGAVTRSMMLSNPDALITSLMPEHSIHVVFDTARYIIVESTKASASVEYTIATWSATKPDGANALAIGTDLHAVATEPVAEDTCVIC